MFKGPHALAQFDRLMLLAPKFRRPASWLTSATDTWYVEVPFVYRGHITPNINQRIGEVRKVSFDKKPLWSAEIAIAHEDVGRHQFYDHRDLPHRHKRVAELEIELAPTRKDGFSSRKEAARWVVNRSLEVGVLTHRRAKYLSPLQLLAECAEEDV